MLLIERLIEKGRIVESDRTKLPDGVLCRVVYPVCNINQMNANKRVYEAEVWEHVLKDPELKEKLEKRSLFGHAEHPQGSASDLQLTSHVIHEMKVDNTKVYQTLDVLDTPTGRIVDCLLRAECNVGVSTRAEGELEEAESKDLGKYQRVIPEKFVYITTDFTADPSTANMAPVEVRRNIVKAAESILSETKASKDDKQFGRSVIDAIACKSAKCDGSGCGACKALEKIKMEPEMESKTIHKMKIQAKVSEALHKAELQTALEAVDELDQAHVNDAQSLRVSLKIANESANKVMGLQSQTIKAEQARDNVNTILSESKKTQRITSKALSESQADFQKLRDQLEAITTSNAALQTKLETQGKEHEAKLQEISEHNISAMAAQGIRAYAQFKIRNSGLILTESTRALLDGCTSEEEVDKVYEQIVDVVRNDALHQSVPKVIQMRETETKKADPNTTKVHKLIGSLIGGK